MGEKRKPEFVFLLKKLGKKSNKVELFNSRNFGDYSKHAFRYRIRSNGRWFPFGKKKEFFYLSEIKNLIFNNLR